jgi:hypothetical protein
VVRTTVLYPAVPAASLSAFLARYPGQDGGATRCQLVDVWSAVAMTGRRWASGVLALAALLPVAGCSAEHDPAPQATPTTTRPAVTSEAPTPEEDAAEAATQAFEGLLRISDAASQEPNARDWEPEIRQFAADPAALLTVQAVRDYATLGLRQEGDSAVDLQVVGVDLTAPAAPTVRMTGCYDSQSAPTIDVGTGEVVPPGTPPRYFWDITVVRFVAEPGQPWLVTTLEPLTDRPC